MSDNVLELEALLVLSELTTPIVCPPDLEVSANEFYSALLETIESHRLPVECTDCSFQSLDTVPPSRRLLIALVDGQIKHLRILVGFEEFGSLAYVDRKYILIPPDLPPVLSSDSDELPPRLTPDSSELPEPDPDPPFAYSEAMGGSAREPLQYKNDTHKIRCFRMEERRQVRREKIIERQEERLALLDEWLAETYETMAQVHWNPSLIYFKDSVDAMIRVVVTDLLEAKGGRARDQEEKVRQEEELREIQKEIMRRFF